MDIVEPPFPAGRVPVGPGEATAAPVTIFDPAIRRLRRGSFVLSARVRVGTHCAVCTAEDGTIVCVLLAFPITITFLS